MRLFTFAGLVLGGASTILLVKYCFFRPARKPSIQTSGESGKDSSCLVTESVADSDERRKSIPPARDVVETTTENDERNKIIFSASEVETVMSMEFMNSVVIDLLKKKFVDFSDAENPASAYTAHDPASNGVRFRIRYPAADVKRIQKLPSLDDILAKIPSGSVTSFLKTSSLPGDGFWPIVLTDAVIRYVSVKTSLSFSIYRLYRLQAS